LRTSARSAIWPALALIAALLVPAQLDAHQFAPALLEVQEREPGRAAVSWKQPAVRVQGSRLRPVLPGSCQGVGTPVVTRAGTGILARWEITCPGGLIGKTLGVEGIATSGADVLLRVAMADGRSFRRVLTPDQPSFLVPSVDSQLRVVWSYARLGGEHILTGWDHLLFVLGLVLLVGRGRTLFWTITAFTVGHSMTLALASLGLVRVPQAPMEAAIALSIYVLAIELVRSSLPDVSGARPGSSPAALGCSTAWASRERSPRSGCPRARSRSRCSRSTSASSWDSSRSWLLS
jgi:hypothetical protein